LLEGGMDAGRGVVVKGWLWGNGPSPLEGRLGALP